MMPQNHIRKCQGDYNFTSSQENVNHFMYMDDSKIFVKKETDNGTAVQTYRIDG